MELTSIHDRAEIEVFLRKNPLIHLYELGDLDDFFWPRTVWFALKEGQEIRQLALIYTGSPLPVLMAIAEEPAQEMDELLRQLRPFLPAKFYAHMGDRAAQFLSQTYGVESHGTYLKFGLKDSSRLKKIDTRQAIKLKPPDEAELKTLYQTGYPGNWFDPRMLLTGFYFGIRQNGRWASAAGVHVVSRQYRVAVLGNVTTHPEFRGRGLATAVCARLCQELLESGVQLIGLNVRNDNLAAIASYKKLGFEQVFVFGEYMCQIK